MLGTLHDSIRTLTLYEHEGQRCDSSSQSLFIFSANRYEKSNTDRSNRSKHAERRNRIPINFNRSVLINCDFKASASSYNSISIQQGKEDVMTVENLE